LEAQSSDGGPLLPPADATQGGENKPKPAPKSANEREARRLLDEAKAKILSIPALMVDVELPVRCGVGPAKHFEKSHQITLERPNKFRVDKMVGTVNRTPQLEAVCDGTRITRMEDAMFVAYEKPLRADFFFMGYSFIVQYFFDTKPIKFDPTDPIWGKSVSLFDKNFAAYDRDVQLRYLEKRTVEDLEYDVVEIKYNTPDTDIRQQVYLDEATYQKFKYQPTASLTIGPGAFKLARPDKMPLVETDPARLGETTPDFKLPGAKGEPAISLKELLAKGKGVLVCTLSAWAGRYSGADTWLKQMRLIQEVKNKFESQGLQVVVIFGDSTLTPDLKQELLLNWTPDLSRFNYPIAIDIDVERGIQGSAYENFELNGRRNLLLDKEGKVVFACSNFDDDVKGKPNMLSLYQALSQIGFSVSQADFEGVVRR
jgi:peroxiredoxin